MLGRGEEAVDIYSISEFLLRKVVPNLSLSDVFGLNLHQQKNNIGWKLGELPSQTSARSQAGKGRNIIYVVIWVCI